MKQIITLILCITCSSIFAQKKGVINKHFDVVEIFSTVRSHSQQLIRNIKKRGDTVKIEDAQYLYFGIKAKADGTAARYISIIRNPRLARQQKEDIKLQLNQLIEEHNKLVDFYEDNYRQDKNNKDAQGIVTFNVPGWIIQAVTELTTTIIKEINDAKEADREKMKADIEALRLKEWDDI